MLDTPSVLIVCPEDPMQGRIAESVQGCGLRSLACSDSQQADILLKGQEFEVVFCSEGLAEKDIRGVIEAAKPAPTLIISESSEWDRYLAALRTGAFDCIAFPMDGPQIKRALWSALIERARVRRKAGIAFRHEGSRAFPESPALGSAAGRTPRDRIPGTGCHSLPGSCDQERAACRLPGSAAMTADFEACICWSPSSRNSICSVLRCCFGSSAPSLLVHSGEREIRWPKTLKSQTNQPGRPRQSHS